MNESSEYDVFLSYSSKDKREVHALATRLKSDVVRVCMETWGSRSPALMEKSRTLVIRTSDGEIRWMNVTDYLQEHGANVRRIVFDREPFTALNIVKLRSKVLGEE